MTRRAIGAALVVVALALDAWACAQLADYVGTSNDLFPRWLATRLWLERGWDPYGAQTSAAISAAIGPAPLAGESFVFGFVYPGYVALLLAPLAALPFHAAATVWLLLGQLCCVGGALAAWRAVERERGLPRQSPLAALTLAALVPATVMNELFLQFAGIVLAALAGSWWLATRARAGGAGMLLVLAAVKPSLGLAPAVALMVGAARKQRTLVLAGAATAALIAGASLAALPAWPGAFLVSTLDYARAARPQSASALIASLVSPDGQAVTTAVVVAGLAIAAISLAWLRSARRTGDALAAGVLASVWLVPPLYEWNSVVLLLVLVPALRALREQGITVFAAAVAGLLIASLATGVLYVSWPSASRIVWPVIALVIYGTPAALRRGSHSMISSGPLPSLAAST